MGKYQLPPPQWCYLDVLSSILSDLLGYGYPDDQDAGLLLTKLQEALMYMYLQTN